MAYTYDNNSRLTAAGSASYGYDWVGNRTTPTGYTYNDADQLYSWPGQHQYTYLGTGSLEYQKDSSGTNVQKAYTYTAANLLESVTHAGVNDPSEMTWDADGNRISFTSSEDSGMTQFVYDTTAGIPAVIEEVLPSTSSVYYIREPNGALVARIAGEDTSYSHFDALGSTRLLTDSAGTVTDTFTYDAWGSLTSRTGSTPQPYMFVGQLGYYSHYQDDNLFDDPSDPDSGWQMLQLGVRFYDPGSGRFTQVDPLPQYRRSTYAYVKDNPCRYADPTGEAMGGDKQPYLPPNHTLDRHCSNLAELVYAACIEDGGDAVGCGRLALVAFVDCQHEFGDCPGVPLPPSRTAPPPPRTVPPPVTAPPVPPRPRLPAPPPFWSCIPDFDFGNGNTLCYLCFSSDEDGKAHASIKCFSEPRF